MHRTFSDELEEAADRIADQNRDDLRILLRRAALKLRDAPGGFALEPAADAVIDELVFELRLPRSEVLRTIVRDWLISHTRNNEIEDETRN